jgi:hypothetical protein
MVDVLPTSTGWGQFPNGNAFPEVFPQEVLMNLHETLVSQAITNTKYEGNISSYGARVTILKANRVASQDGAVGGTIDLQELDDDAVQLDITEMKQAGFRLDDAEERISHIDWFTQQAAEVAFELRRGVDQNILEHMRDNASTNASVGTSGSAKTVNNTSGADLTPLDYMAEASLLLDENDVPLEGRFFAAGPAFINQLRREASSLADASKSGFESASYVNSNLMFGGIKLHGFTIYQTTNMPLTAGSDKLTLFGHTDATATAMSLVQARTEYENRSFIQNYLSRVLFGRKVIRPEMLFSGAYATA